MHREMTLKNCCQNPTFHLVEELGHTEAVDWDLGKCASCGSHLLRQWSEYAPNSVFYDRLSEEEAAKFQTSQEHDRKQLLKDWYNDH